MAEVWVLKILSGPHVGAEIPLDSGTWTLGRDEECDLVLTDDTLAERHIELTVSPEGVQVTNLAQGQNIYLSGEPQPNNFSLPSHTVVMAGSLYFAVGAAGQPWPELSLSGPSASASPVPSTPVQATSEEEIVLEGDIPVLNERVEDDELEMLEAAPQAQVSSKTKPEPAKKNHGFLASLLLKASETSVEFDFLGWCSRHPIMLGGALLSGFFSILIGAFFWLWMMTDPEKTAMENITPAQKAESIITQMNVPDVTMKKLPDGSVIISGYVADNNVKDSLQKALNNAKVPYNFQAVVMNEMRATAASVLEQYDFKQMTIELDTTPGSLVLSGYAANPKEVARIREILQQEVHGLISIVDQVEYQVTRLKALRTMLKERGLAQKIRLLETPGKVILKGRLGDASQGYYLKEVVQDFREKYRNRPELVIDATLPATDLATMQPLLKIKSVSLGRIPYVILDNGEKYLRGAKLKNGYILENINLEYLTLKLGQERIKYFIGGGVNGG
ncbi:type III secretion system inner membrane ring subunit SctD [Sansalvadorimonas verongulae]|uniref:type III secretion system inner membrane ring subunit SctD n=1 Tax=Sansalvadorimonas verongulae TaxID=2172824 RepID=UPI0012BCA4AF|nr:type III secretion system inner membrane ring subunit SctD [Sansalvadorimonas verongulae]MTI15268.1 EscD/YscD/HrpQ family type III secretion system inner membrane ring protein [Sansalvadorimonas verongulae]